MNKKIKVYYAGKIYKNDWRAKLYDFDDIKPDECKKWIINGFYDIVTKIKHKYPQYEYLEYAGPFFVNYIMKDHYYGENTHGVGIGLGCKDIDGPQRTSPTVPLGANLKKEDLKDLQKIEDFKRLQKKNCYKADIKCINNSDVVFAYIDDITAYGTLVELGYAFGQGKKIFIAYNLENDDDYNSLWFSQNTADRFERVSDILEAQDKFISWLEEIKFDL